MTHALRSAAVASITALAAVAALLAADLTPPAQAQSEDEAGRIVARRLASGRTEFGWQTPSGARVLPQSRYFPAPADATVDRWLRSSPVEVGGVAIGRINARLRADGRIEFAFTPTDGERIEPSSRYFPAAPGHRRWLRSTEITIGRAAPRYIAVSAGRKLTCGLRNTGELWCWGYAHGEEGHPPGRYTAVSAGSAHACAIRESGAITCWGSNHTGQTDAPAGSYRAVSAGSWHTCGLRESGAILCWGDNDEGQSDAPAGSFTAVSAGGLHTCGLRDTGAIECWGWNHYGQTNAPSGNFRAVSAGRYHACAIRESDDKFTCWGLNIYGVGEEDDTPTFGAAVNAISGGDKFTCAIHKNRASLCWGRGWVAWIADHTVAISAGGDSLDPRICAIVDDEEKISCRFPLAGGE